MYACHHSLLSIVIINNLDNFLSKVRRFFLFFFVFFLMMILPG